MDDSKGARNLLKKEAERGKERIRGDKGNKKTGRKDNEINKEKKEVS